MKLALQQATVRLDLWPGISVAYFDIMNKPLKWNDLHNDTNNIVAKGDVWMKTRFPFLSSLNKSHIQVLKDCENQVPSPNLRGDNFPGLGYVD